MYTNVIYYADHALQLSQFTIWPDLIGNRPDLIFPMRSGQTENWYSGEYQLRKPCALTRAGTVILKSTKTVFNCRFERRKAARHTYVERTGQRYICGSTQKFMTRSDQTTACSWFEMISLLGPSQYFAQNYLFLCGYPYFGIFQFKGGFPRQKRRLHQRNGPWVNLEEILHHKWALGQPRRNSWRTGLWNCVTLCDLLMVWCIREMGLGSA